MSLPVSLELLAKSALLILATLAYCAAATHTSAARKSAAWLTLFLMLLLLPFTKLAPTQWRLFRSETTAVLPRPLPAAAAEPGAPADASAEEPARERTLRPSVSKLAFVVWLFGLGAVAGYRLLGSVQTVHLKRRSIAAGARMQELARHAAAEMHAPPGWRVLLADGGCMPCVCGICRPTVLLPVEAADWSDERLLATLRHEFAHAARRDPLARWLTTLVCAIYWPNPLVWLAARRLHEQQEQSCDDMVLSAGTPPEAYATILLETAREFALSAPRLHGALGMARLATLEHRIVSIVSSDRNRRSADWAVALACGSTALCLLAGTALAQTAPGERAIAPQTDYDAGAPAVVIKAGNLIVPAIDFEDTSARECVAFLTAKSRALDPEAKGVNLTVASEYSARKITISLRNISVFGAAKYVAALAGGHLTIDANRLVIDGKHPAAAAPEQAEAKNRSAQIPTGAGSAALAAANRIEIPELSFRETTIAEAVDFLRDMSRKLDPEKRGVNLILHSTPHASEGKITVRLANIPVGEAARYLANLTDLELTSDGNALILGPKAAGRPEAH